MDENAVRLDLDDLGGEIVSYLFVHFYLMRLFYDAHTALIRSVYWIGAMVEMMKQQSRHPTVALLLTS